MRARIIDLSLTLSGKQRLTLELDSDFRQQVDELRDSDVDVTVKRFREKRSLDANAYAWLLIDRLSEKLRIPKEEIYRDHIRQIGGACETVCIQSKALPRLRQIWERNGLGWQVEDFPSKIPGCVNVHLYYGSSSYDKRQMSALIDLLVDSCKSCGIETLPPHKLELLKGDYK